MLPKTITLERRPYWTLSHQLRLHCKWANDVMCTMHSKQNIQTEPACTCYFCDRGNVLWEWIAFPSKHEVMTVGKTNWNWPYPVYLRFFHKFWSWREVYIKEAYSPSLSNGGDMLTLCVMVLSPAIRTTKYQIQETTVTIYTHYVLANRGLLSIEWWAFWVWKWYELLHVKHGSQRSCPVKTAQKQRQPG